MILHDHLDAVELLRRYHPSMVVSERQRRKAQQQVSGLFQVLVNAVRRANQEYDISRESRRERIGKLDRVHEFAFFGKNDTLVFATRKLFFRTRRLPGQAPEHGRRAWIP